MVSDMHCFDIIKVLLAYTECPDERYSNKIIISHKAYLFWTPFIRTLYFQHTFSIHTSVRNSGILTFRLRSDVP